MDATEVQVERMTAADLGVTLKAGMEHDTESREIIEGVDNYLRVFAKPIKRGSEGTGFCFGSVSCLKCRSALGGMLGSFTWGLAHGEGACSSCGWPARAYHNIKDRKGVPLFNRPLDVVLQYHPDEIKD